jgi:hypothetical protein
MAFRLLGTCIISILLYIIESMWQTKDFNEAEAIMTDKLH